MVSEETFQFVQQLMFIYEFIQLKHILVNGKNICIQLIMDELEPPQAFSFDGNVSHSWKFQLEHFDFHLAATEEDTKGNKIKTSIFLTCIGQK